MFSWKVLCVEGEGGMFMLIRLMSYLYIPIVVGCSSSVLVGSVFRVAVIRGEALVNDMP